MRGAIALVGLGLACAAIPAQAEGLRPLCASRPGLGTPPCILDKRHVQAEIGIISSQTDAEDTIGADTLAFASTEIIYGIDGINQIAVVWAPFNRVTVTNSLTGEERAYSGVGDVALRWRHSLRNPDGEGLSIALEGLVNIPTGTRQISTNDWGFGILLPVSIALSDTLSLITTPGFVWSENRNSNGQHFDFSGSFGFAKDLGAFTLTLELGYNRDGEPGSALSSATVAPSLAWAPPGNANFQLDLGASLAINDDAPDLQVYLGVVQRF